MKFRLVLLFVTLSIHALQNASSQTRLLAEVSAGELLDKITILMIKLEHMKDAQKRSHVQTELDSLGSTAQDAFVYTPELDVLIADLLAINKKLWDIEDAIRIKESKKEFDLEFIELARSVYFTNDRRAHLKRAINDLLGSRLIEEKSLPSYQQVA